MMDDNLTYIVNHVFFPPKLPQQDDFNTTKEYTLCEIVHQYAVEYQRILSIDDKPRWDPITRMLANLRDTQELLSEEQIKRSLIEMHPGDVLAFFIRAQNAGVIMRKLNDKTVFESFEVSLPNAVVMAAKGKLICSYPGPAIAVSSTITNDPTFRDELSSFLVQMDFETLDSTPKTTKAGSTVPEVRDTVHPRHITQLLTGILHGMGQIAETTRIQKRIGDDILWKGGLKPWRRSPLWLVIRVALQTTLYQEGSGHSRYKAFMVFLTAKILEHALQQGFSSDLVFCMRAKMSRRLYKLGSAAPDFVVRTVHAAGNAAEQILQERWSNVQENQASSARWAPNELDIPADTHLSLLNSKSYISKVLQNKFSYTSSYTFEPKHSPRSRNFRSFCGDGLSGIFAADPRVALADFESAVQNDLDEWVIENLHTQSACTTLATCITQYSEVARLLYASNPEDLSLMILTIFELWVALDKVAVAQCSLLQDYSPEIPLDILQSLLLRRSKSLQRVTSIEKYLRERHRLASSGKSIFANGATRNSFAVRYFETSSQHQSLLSRIEKDADSERQLKVHDLELKNASYEKLMEESRSLEHKYRIDHRQKKHHKKKSCQKCAKETKASSLWISVHEWPLPHDPLEAQAVVFELDCPVAFGVWRTTTYYILFDICRQHRNRSKSSDPPVKLETYNGLSSYHSCNTMLRITLASATKSFLGSHYKTTRIPSTETSVCVQSGLQFKLFDKLGCTWVIDSFSDCSVVPYCTLQLPTEGVYQSLQYAVDGTSHTSNGIMANQSECSKGLNLHEYIAFTSLRSGHRLQWLNVIRELAARCLSLHREEVHTLLMQATLQIGHLMEDGEREWHVELKNGRFGLVLLQELEDLTTSIEASWLEGVTMRTITALTCRLLASTDDPHVTHRAYSLLRKARDVTFQWVRQLSSKLRESGDECEFQHRVCEIAITCRGTYDVDLDHLPSLLESSKDVAVLVECAILVYDNTPPSLTDLPTHFRRLLDRDRRLSHLLEPLLHRRIQERREGLDLAIAVVWPGYRPKSDWRQLSAPNDRWIITTTASGGFQESQHLQLNLLDGQLLISGKPLRRLPQSIVTHATFSRMFNKEILYVIPADMPGMDFMTLKPISDNQVFFGLRDNGTQLVIRTRCGSQILELVPHDQFSGDLPASLVQGHAHWLDLSNGEIELRTLEKPWRPANQNWRIQFSNQNHSIMHKEQSLFLVDIRSPTSQMISACLKPLEYAENLVITHSKDGCPLSVDLPRFRLAFFLNSGRLLESQIAPGMVIDSNQSTGTMFGLTSQLVLCAQDTITQKLPRSRRVIIPYGRPHFSAHNNHISIVVDTASQRKVDIYEYSIDTHLGRLVGNANLISKLYKVYLHAISSHCLSDPLTGQTGTEEALRELCSAGCWSFQRLGATEADLLHQIACLAPSRVFYPRDREVMQRVEWSSDLVPLSQHHAFHTTSHSIMEYAEQLRVFHRHSELDSHALDKVNLHLLERAGRRAAMYYPEEYTGTFQSKNEDVAHTSRHFAGDEETADVWRISNMVYRWPSALDTSKQLFNMFKQWEYVSGQDDGVTLSYNSTWFHQDLANTFIPLYNLCRRSSRDKHCFQLMFSLSAMTYGSSDGRNLIPTLLAFASTPRFRTLSPPSWSSYNLLKGFQPNKEQLLRMVKLHAISFQSSSEASLAADEDESPTSLAERRRTCFTARVNAKAVELVDSLVSQWPCEEPKLPSDSATWPFDMPSVISQASILFRSWFQNKELRDHVGLVQTVLDEVRESDSMQIDVPEYKWIPNQHAIHDSVPSSITFQQLLKRSGPNVNHLSPEPMKVPETTRRYQRPKETSSLQCLLSEFQIYQENAFYRLYADDLDKSRITLDSCVVPAQPGCVPYSFEMVLRHSDQCQKYLQDISTSILQSLLPLNDTEEAMRIAGLWPRITTRSLLGQLAFGTNEILTDQWKMALISLVQGVLLFQRSQRLLRWALLQNHEEFFKELENTGHWVRNVTENLDWLLIQVDSDFLVRPIQSRVAQEMIVPTSKHNTVLQLNMGEGKSSVIVPMVSAALADGQKLVRVTVLKSLSSQMFQLLVERLSGLVNRRIFYLPFSRTVKIDSQKALLIRDLYEHCMRVGGILVVQPEHTLSFKLMSVDRLICSTSSTDYEVARILLETQRWLEMYSRDILDESDEILHVRYQLTYTAGQHLPPDGHPDRWITTQQVLSLVKRHAPQVQQMFPHDTQVQKSHNGNFPSLRILHTKAGEALVFLIAKDALDGALPNYPFRVFPERVRQAAMRMITEVKMPEEDTRLIKEYCEGSELWNGLLLLRGLLAYGILVYTLKERRWRVDYGLDPSRSLLAVPYRAKDVPSARAEISHSDVAILLTCLSYYYGGLSSDQLDLCFELLSKLDNPAMEYENWIHDVDLIPEVLRRLSGVNVKDPEQRQQYLLPIFQHNHAVVDFFLSRVVFPKEAKEFPEKLTTSGWDIAETKHHVTTGFSGTNDNRYLLPTSIHQHDPVDQLGTNAQVLNYILLPENNHYTCFQCQVGEHPSTQSTLELVVRQTPEIRVLLDVGAQMLELHNAELAEHWLSLKPGIPAAVFFDDNDELAVLTRDGTIELFIFSAYKQMLDQCLIYLDDAHTRGTDLKLPRDFRAAVTLGPKVTKDRLLQGCMRMRKLGQGQSVMFFAPQEVDQSIRTAANKDPLDKVETLDILRWAMLETCADIQYHVPQWAQQGNDYECKRNVWKEFSFSDSASIERLKSSWLQPEARTLETMYGVRTTIQSGDSPFDSISDIPEIRKRCQMLGVSTSSDTRMAEEQEREVDHEIELEREVERPPKAEAAKHKVRRHVRKFVEKGIISHNSSFIPIFSTLRDTIAAPSGYYTPWSPSLLATRDFSTTVQNPSHVVGDYLRPVNWIISSAASGSLILVVLSPYEVNALLPEIRESKAVHLHLYAARSTQAMKSFDDLRFYCIPPLPPTWTSPTVDLVPQLSLWAGQLYLPDYATYLRLCEFLGIYTRELESSQDISIQHDGFVKPKNRQGAMISACRFTDSPLPFLKQLIGLRRKGIDYSLTHLGKILRARLLMEGDFEH